MENDPLKIVQKNLEKLSQNHQQMSKIDQN
ncbi:Protein CBG25159 [Caenorhabditis briggsae]|uniref:Protein CBG25159 n=1 Tax=Caenorhabditis briggsae TaxID=6238 RepID=B6IID2_CAEBR|nr:Protein CBG25159 [Caenorhabditis briggsae]CAR99662.1 Protein CBG25159 [Caenorhabditis briggsae]